MTDRTDKLEFHGKKARNSKKRKSKKNFKKTTNDHRRGGTRRF